MKQRSRYRRWVIGIAASLMAGVVLTVALCMAKVPWVKFTWDGILHDEPFCEGRPASYWIARYWRSPQDRLEAVRALSKRRDVTIPFLLGDKGDRPTADGQRIEILEAVILEMPRMSHFVSSDSRRPYPAHRRTARAREKYYARVRPRRSRTTAGRGCT